MPTFVYKFLDSGDTIEVQQAFTDDALTEAPHPSDGVVCPVRKVFTPVGVTFKGNGFYKTDSRPRAAGTLGADELVAGLLVGRLAPEHLLVEHRVDDQHQRRGRQAGELGRFLQFELDQRSQPLAQPRQSHAHPLTWRRGPTSASS